MTPIDGALLDGLTASGIILVLAAVAAMEPTVGRVADVADELGDRRVSEREARLLDAWRGDGVCVVSGPRTD